MTPIVSGSLQVAPLNTVERVFDILCLAVGCTRFTTLVSPLSSQMAFVQAKLQHTESSSPHQQLISFADKRMGDGRTLSGHTSPGGVNTTLGSARAEGMQICG